MSKSLLYHDILDALNSVIDYGEQTIDFHEILARELSGISLSHTIIKQELDNALAVYSKRPNITDKLLQTLKSKSIEYRSVLLHHKNLR